MGVVKDSTTSNDEWACLVTVAVACRSTEVSCRSITVAFDQQVAAEEPDHQSKVPNYSFTVFVGFFLHSFKVWIEQSSQ